MSAPDTNTEKQAKKHAVPLIGMIGGLVLAAILIVALLFFVSSSEEDGVVEEGTDGVGVLASPPSSDGVGDDDDVPAVD
jgi:hypothetical protein